jgi:hypothetical protein
MGQQVKSWRSAHDSRVWLSMLVRAMEQASRPEVRSLPCDPAILAGFYAQLSRPASPRGYGTSAFRPHN